MESLDFLHVGSQKKKYFLPKMAENGFFEISPLTFFFRICSLMKAYAICCVYAQSHIWENFGS